MSSATQLVPLGVGCLLLGSCCHVAAADVPACEQPPAGIESQAELPGGTQILNVAARVVVISGSGR
jgi:hypothetical protein